MWFNTVPRTLAWLDRLSLHVSWITRPYQNTILLLEHYNFHNKLEGLNSPNTNLLLLPFTLLRHISQSSTKIKNVWFYNSTSSYAFMPKCLVKHTGTTSGFWPTISYQLRACRITGYYNTTCYFMASFVHSFFTIRANETLTPPIGSVPIWLCYVKLFLQPRVLSHT